MDVMIPLIRTIHIVAAAVLVGAAAFVALAFVPALAGNAQAQQIREAVAARWKGSMMGAMTVLIVTGLFNFWKLGLPKAEIDSGYHMWFGIKVLLAFAAFFLGSVLVGRAPAFEGLRRNAGTWYRILLLVGIATIAVSGLLNRIG